MAELRKHSELCSNFQAGLGYRMIPWLHRFPLPCTQSYQFAHFRLQFSERKWPKWNPLCWCCACQSGMNRSDGLRVPLCEYPLRKEYRSLSSPSNLEYLRQRPAYIFFFKIALLQKHTARCCRRYPDRDYLRNWPSLNTESASYLLDGATMRKLIWKVLLSVYRKHGWSYC